ncbi:MAG TPA: DUF1906 domain-containing protein [Solirubrobacterales bacterium]
MVVALLLVIASCALSASLVPVAAGAAAATGGICSATGADGCPAGGAGRPALTVRSGGATSSALSPPAPEGTVVAGPSVFTGYGFDACTAPSSRSMRAWRESSPFEAVGVYIGGRNRACTQPSLTAAWVGEQVADGWHLIPIYVGLQATTSSCASCAALNSSFAAVQAETEAEDAVADAEAIGIGPGSPIYHDMESYTRTASATASTMTFLAAWTTRLHQLGYSSGVYSSSASGIADLGSRWGTSFASPDDIWTANWNGRADTEDPNLSDDAWPNHQRIHQYRGGHDEVWGGVRINIDSNYVDAMTVGTATAALRQLPPLTISRVSVSGKSLRVRVRCGWTPDLICPGQIRLRTRVRTTARRHGRKALESQLRRIAVAARTFRLRGGSSHTFTIVLDSRGQPLLAERGRLRAQLLVAIPGARKTRSVLFP